MKRGEWITLQRVKDELSTQKDTFKRDFVSEYYAVLLMHYFE